MRDKVTSGNCIEIMHTWFPSNPKEQAKAWSTVHEWCCQNGLNGYEPELDWQRPGLVKVIEFFEKKDAKIASLESQLEDRNQTIKKWIELGSYKDKELSEAKKELERLKDVIKNQDWIVISRLNEVQVSRDQVNIFGS